MVNFFWIKGDLNIFLVIVNGFLIFDDVLYVFDLKVIRVFKLLKNIILFIGVFLINSNFFLRMSIRRIWM